MNALKGFVSLVDYFNKSHNKVKTCDPLGHCSKIIRVSILNEEKSYLIVRVYSMHNTATHTLKYIHIIIIYMLAKVHLHNHFIYGKITKFVQYFGYAQNIYLKSPLTFWRIIRLMAKCKRARHLI